MSQPFDISNPNRKIHVGVILMDCETEVLDVANIDAFNSMSAEFLKDMPISDELKAQGIDLQCHWVNESGKEAKLTAGLRIQPTDSFETAPPLDVAIIGAHIKMDYKPSEAEIAYVRKTYEECSSFITICGGSLLGIPSGIFKGKTVTGPKFLLEQLRAQEPDANWVEKRWVRDGKLWTSGALLNGLDLTRAWFTEIWGKSEKHGVLAMQCLELGSYPLRDVDYKDV